jgi:hypothetical protein
MDEQELYGWKFKLYIFGWRIMNAPYDRWGTTYKLDMEAWEDD